MNIREFLEDRGVPIAPAGHHHVRTGWTQIDCPYCSPDSNRWLMGISDITSSCNCYQCGPHSGTKTIAMLCNIPVGQAFTVFKGLDHSQFEQTAHVGRYKPPSGVGPLLKPHRDYLRSRGLKPSEIDMLWKIGGIGISGVLSWRIFIPVFWQARPVSWLTRAIGMAPKRYLAALDGESDVPRSSVLYGADYCRSSIVVTEGPVDAWVIGQGATSICGLEFSHAQVAIISRYPRRAICFDAEPEAQKRARALADAVSIFPGTTDIVELEHGKDAGATDLKEVKQIRKHFLKDR